MDYLQKLLHSFKFLVNVSKGNIYVNEYASAMRIKCPCAII